MAQNEIQIDLKRKSGKTNNFLGESCEKSALSLKPIGKQTKKQSHLDNAVEM